MFSRAGVLRSLTPTRHRPDRNLAGQRASDLNFAKPLSVADTDQRQVIQFGQNIPKGTIWLLANGGITLRSSYAAQ